MGEQGGLSASDVLALTNRDNNGNGGMFGGELGGIIGLLIVAGLLNGGLGGFGGFGGGGRGASATQEDVRNAVDQQTLISKLDQQTYGLADTFNSLSNILNTNFRGIDNAICTLGFQNQSGINTLSSQLAKCCCDNEMAIMNLGAGIDKQFCSLGNLIQSNTRDILENNNCNTRNILDFLVQDKISTLTAENQALRLKASQEAQNAYLLNELKPCPSAAYIVPNPNCCYNYSINGVGYGNGGCGCGTY